MPEGYGAAQSFLRDAKLGFSRVIMHFLLHLHLKNLFIRPKGRLQNRGMPDRSLSEESFFRFDSLFSLLLNPLIS
ncbi:hypothetical protein, partial [Succinimonas sp.]|uniref:hypothetical protein n=1 Tax=Succinimonas sp. TaxID=1936151 RepID=UPI0038680CEA